MKLDVKTKTTSFELYKVDNFRFDEMCKLVVYFRTGECKVFTNVKQVITVEELKEQFVCIICYNNLDELRAGCPRNGTRCSLDDLNKIVENYLSKYTFLIIEQCQ